MMISTHLNLYVLARHNCHHFSYLLQLVSFALKHASLTFRQKNLEKKIKFVSRVAVIQIEDLFGLVSLFNPIYPTPPLGQDMTQGQFLSGV